ncbi:MAG: outer membrane lipoprotein-sorting protein [Candidatus Aminicenantes bacterium]|nr:outer membrane lipoprotein-sorting protein [Candidatus Aminicenantes bacterium]
MKRWTRSGRLGAPAILALCLTLPAAPARDAREILRKVDELYRSDSSRARFALEIVTPHWRRTLTIDAWSRGMEKTFLRILEPKKERGMSTLRIGNEMWNFLPKTNKVMKIPPSMMMSSWMGSDFTNDDLVKEYTFIKDYDFAMSDYEAPAPGEIYIRCTPKKDRPIVWGHILIAVREKDTLPVWEKFYDEKGRLVREMSFRQIREFSGRRIPSVMELVSTAKEGNRTTLRYLEAEFDLDIPEETFSLRNLRQRI